MKKKNFEDYTENLMYMKVCQRGHVGPNGRNVKIKKKGCLACQCRMPDGPFTHQFENVEEPTAHKRKYATKEEAYAAHVQRVIEWNNRNKDKTRVYQKTYGAKEERIKFLKECYEKKKVSLVPGTNETYQQMWNRTQREKYALMPEDQKEIIRKQSRERYAKDRLKDKE